jgi:penicillin G amidase
VYADVEGTIGYQCTGRFPVRRAGDGSTPVAGWTSDHEWEGYLPYEELPWSEDPGSGFLVTANHRIHDDDYPHLIGVDFHTGFRARRIADLLEPNHAQTAADSAAIQVDTVSLPARRLLSRLLATEARSDAARRALGLLEGWSGDLEAGSAAAAVYQVWVGRVAVVAFGDVGGDRSLIDEYVAWREAFVCTALPALLDGGAPPPGGGSWDQVLSIALDEAVELLAERFGDDEAGWRWGALHRVRFAHPLARLPGIGAMFVAGDHELGGDEQTVLQGGFDARLGFDAVVVPSWRLVVDLADPDGSLAVLTTGQSGNPASPHWNDQSELWASGELRACPLTRPAVEAAAEHAQQLVPG